MAALRAVSLTDTPRGPIKFDHFGNVVGTFYIRRCGTEGAKYGLKLWNKVDQNLRERQSVLDLAGAGISRASGLFARLSAADEVLKSAAIAVFTGRTGFARSMWNDNVKATAKG